MIKKKVNYDNEEFSELLNALLCAFCLMTMRLFRLIWIG